MAPLRALQITWAGSLRSEGSIRVLRTSAMKPDLSARSASGMSILIERSSMTVAIAGSAPSSAAGRP
jgi:hypothetical protein